VTGKGPGGGTRSAARPAGWHADFAIVRTPLFPFGDLAAIGEGLRALAAAADSAVPDIGSSDIGPSVASGVPSGVPDIRLVPSAVPDIGPEIGAGPIAPDDSLDAAVASDRGVLRARIASFLERPEAREAIFVASPSLEASIGAWRDDPDSARGAKVERALVRFLARMAGRATPFGLLAGWALADVAAETRLELGPRAEARRWSRVDLHVLGRLAEHAVEDDAVRRTLRLRPNPTLRPVGGARRYVEAREGRSGRDLFLSSVERTPWLEAALDRAREGAPFPEVSAALAAAFGVEPGESDAFVGALVESRVLVPEIEIRVTGAPPHAPFAADLRRSAATAPWADALDAAAGSLAALDAGGLGHAPERYREALRPLAALPVELDEGLLVQVDLERRGQLAVGEAVVAELGRALDALCRLVPEREPPELGEFREAFLRRHGDAEVPLLEALDEDAGLGFGGSAAQERAPSPLLAGIRFPTGDAPEPLPWGGAPSRLLVARYGEALASGAREIALGDEEIEALPAAGDPAPAALAAFASLLTTGPARGDFLLFLRLALGPPAGSLAGRFCHQDEALAARVRDLCRAEAAMHPGAVLAEIVHLPEGRVGNVVCRPVLRPHEIPWLSAPAASEGDAFPPSDLLVAVRGARVRLRSSRDGREIVPRLTTAHGYEHGTTVYRFLGTLQSQGTRPKVRFSWGPLSDAPFLPRVRIGRVVVFPASWRLSPGEIARLSGARGAALVRAARALWEGRGMPPRLSVGEGDNETIVDVRDVLSLESLAHYLRDKETVRVSEVPYDVARGAVVGPDGWYANEIVVPMLRRPPPGEPPAGRPGGGGAEVPRARPPPAPRHRHPPGSAWLYARLHCGPTGADEVLLRAVGPLVHDLRRRGVADRWHFLRHGDPDWHLRLRLHGDPARLARDGLPALHAATAPLLDDGLLSRVALDTYEPEVERYGGADALTLAEAWFEADSEAALATMEALAAEGRDEERGLAALESVVRTWQEMGYAGEALRQALLRSRDAFRAELGADGELLRAAGARHRELGGRLREILPADGSSLRPPAPGSPLAARAAATRGLAETYRGLDARGALAVPLAEVAWSLAHMAANRLVTASARRHELVLHELACRHLESLRHHPA
jgi:thiopeptide-type bacteriocin biosynthesis protein